MEFAIPGFVKRFCIPNAILTLSEYVQDYASVDTKQKALQAIKRELEQMPESNPLKEKLLQKLSSVQKGERDLFF